MKIANQDRLEQIWKRLWDLRTDESEAAVKEKQTLIAEMDALDPSGMGLLESIREPNTADDADDEAFLRELKDM